MGLPVWRSPSPAPGPRDGQKQSRSPIRRHRNNERITRDFASAAFARMSDRGSNLTSTRLSDRVRVPERREELSRPARTFVSQSSSLLPLPPPVPELRSYTRSPVPMDTTDSRPTEAIYSDSRERLRQAAERVNRMRARLDSLEEERRSIRNRAQTGSDRSPPEPIWARPVPMIRTREETVPTDSRTGNALDNTELEAFLPEGAEYTTSPRPVSGAVDDFPPLRRMGRGSVVDAPLPPSGLRESWSHGDYDGLGDRSRSFSPESDHWETMLTSIRPDANLPSADSSFTSAAASASFSASRSHSADSSSHSASSSRTSLTVPSDQERERERERELACDTDEDGPVDPLTAGIRQRDLDRGIRRPDPFRRFRERRSTRPANGLSSSRRQRIHIHGPLRSPRRERASADASTPGPVPTFHDWILSRGGEPVTMQSQHSQAADAILNRMATRNPFASTEQHDDPEGELETFTYSAANSADESGDDAAAPARIAHPSGRMFIEAPQQHEHASSADEDLDSLRAIVERLARRDDVPDGWWASVGLTPAFAQRVRRDGGRDRDDVARERL